MMMDVASQGEHIKLSLRESWEMSFGRPVFISVILQIGVCRVHILTYMYLHMAE